MEAAAVKANFSREETKELVISVRSRPQEENDFQIFCLQKIKIILIFIILFCPVTFQPVKLNRLCKEWLSFRNGYCYIFVKPLEWKRKVFPSIIFDVFVSNLLWWLTETKLWKLCHWPNTSEANCMLNLDFSRSLRDISALKTGFRSCAGGRYHLASLCLRHGSFMTGMALTAATTIHLFLLLLQPLSKAVINLLIIYLIFLEEIIKIHPMITWSIIQVEITQFKKIALCFKPAYCLIPTL